MKVTVLLALVVGLILVAMPSAAVASSDLFPGGGGGGCTPSSVTETFHIFVYTGANTNSIQFNGQVYSDAQTSMTIQGGCGNKYLLQPNSIESGYVFYGWVASAGTFDSNEARSTYFYPAKTPTIGSITMVLYFNQALTQNSGWLTSIWAGYVESGSNTNTATGEFQIPSYISYLSGGTNPELVSLWVGIGGFLASGNGNTWQAGVDLSVSSSNAVTLRAWYENPSAYSAQFDSTQLTPYLHQSDYIKVSLSWNPSSPNVGTFSITDSTNSHEWGPLSETLCGKNNMPDPSGACYPPDTLDAEWLVEISAAPPSCSPSFSGFWYTSLSDSGYTNLNGPLGALSAQPYPGDCPFSEQINTFYNGGPYVDQNGVSFPIVFG